MKKRLLLFFALFRDSVAGLAPATSHPKGSQLMQRTVQGFLLATMLLSGSFLKAQTTTKFNDGYLTVFKVTSASALGNTGTAIVTEEYLPATTSQSAPNYSVSLPAGANGVVISGTASSAGAMTRSENGRYLIIPGYAAAVGDANSTFTANGTARTLSGNGTLGLGVKGSIYTTANDLRGATSDDGTNFWFSGGSLGTRYTNNGTTITTIQSGTTTSYVNTRVVNIFNGQLFYATGSGTPSAGIYQVGTGKPTTTGQAATILTAPSAPYGFSISPDGLTIYSVNTASTVVRYTYSGAYNASTFTYSGGSWSTASAGFTLSAVTGVAIDWNNYSFSTGTNGAVVYAINGTTLVKGTDNGTSAISTTTLRTLTGNNAFRGLAFSPVKQTVSKSATSPVASNIQGATANAVLFGFTLTADEGNSTIKKLILNQSGTATTGAGNDISNFRLIEDANNNGVADAGEISAAVATGTATGANITFSAVSTAYIAEGSQKNFLVIGDVSATATTGVTFIPAIVANKTINSVTYTNNLVNAGGSYVTIGATPPTGSTLTISSPTLSYTGTLAALTTTQGTASAKTSFAISGQSLTAGISINPPAGFEISTTADFSSNVGSNGSPVTVGTAGTVASTTLYVRLAASTAVGTYSGDIVASSPGAVSAIIATASSTVTSPAAANQTIAFPAIANATYGDAPFALGATASSALAVTYTSANTAVATVSGATVTIVGAGEVTIFADQAGNSAYNAAPEVSNTFTVAAKNLTVGNAVVTAKVYDTTTAAEITGATLTGVVNGDTVTVSGAGDFADANAGENKTVTSALVLGGDDSANYTLTQPALTGTITKADQVITFGALPNKITLDADFDAAATSASAAVNPITYTSSDTAVATIAGSNIHLVGAGGTDITASQAATQNYNAAVSVIQNLTVIEPVLTAGNIVVVKVGTGSAALSNASVPVYLSEYTTGGAATMSIPVPATTAGNRVVMSGSATSEGQLNLSGDGQYLTLTGYDAPVGIAGIASSASATYNRVVGRVSANAQVAFTSMGSSLYTGNNIRSAVTQDGSRYWTAGAVGGVYTIENQGAAATQLFTTPANTRTISIFGGQLYTSTSTTLYTVGSGLPVTTAVPAVIAASTDPYAYTIVDRGNGLRNMYVASGGASTGVTKWVSTNGGAWTLVGSGTLTSPSSSLYGITARVSGSNVELYASSTNTIYTLTDTADATTAVSGSFTAIATAPANTAFRGIAFSPALLAPVVTNTALAIDADLNIPLDDYTITAVNAPASYNATGLPQGVSVDTETGVISGAAQHAGTYNVSISATNAAGTGTKTLIITVAKGNQAIVFDALAPKDVNDPDFELTATSQTVDVNPITYTSSTTTVATISGTTVHIVGVGSTVITAYQAETSDYSAATSVAQTQVVTSASLTDQTISFPAIANATYGDAPLTLNATASSGLTVTYTSSDPAIASISGNTVTILNIGTVNITASQSGDGTYNAASDVVQPLTIGTKTLTVTGAAVSTKTYDTNATATVTGGVLNGIVGSDVVTLVNGTNTFASVNAGTNIPVATGFTLAGAQANRYTVAQPAITGTITKANQAITFAAFPVKSDLEPASALTSFSTTSAVNPVTYSSSNPLVATVTGTTLTIVGAGTATITASQAESANFNATSTGKVLTVQPGLYLNQFTGVSACPTNGNIATVPTNAAGTEATRSTIACNSTANVFNSVTLNNTATVNDASYIQFSVSATPGYKLDLSSLYFFRQASNSAPNQLELRYSTDGFATSNYVQYTAPVSSPTGTYLNWDFADFTSPAGGTVTFRLYPYGTQRADLTGASAASGTFRIDDVTVFGTVAPLCYTWNGTVNSDWNTAANWCDNTLPTATADVTITNTANDPVISTGVAHAKSITITDAAATLTVNSGATLSVEYNIASNAVTGNIIVQNNGAILQRTSATANGNTGKIVFHKNSNPLYRLDYTLWSAPITGQTLRAFSMATSNNRFYVYDYADNGVEFDEGYWPVDPITTSFAEGKGYLIRMPNSVTGLTGYSEGTTPYTVDGTFTGKPNNGSYSPALIQTAGASGFNAVGNPYPSPISLKDFLNGNSTSLSNTTAIWLWRKKNGAETSYLTLNLTGLVVPQGDTNGNGALDAELASYYQGDNTNWVIAPGQGFIVQAQTGAATVSFNNSMRRATPGAQAFFRQAATTASRYWLNLKAQNGNGSQALIAYRDDATMGIDYGYDSKVFNTAELSLYSLATDNKLTIQARPGFEAGDVVPMGFTAPAAGTYTISIDHMDGVFSQGQAIYLKDLQEGVIRNLSLNDYTFTTEAGTFEGRFEVHYQTQALGTDNPVLDANSVVVYKQGNTVNINTGSAIMNSVKVFDIRGRQLYSQGGINATETVISNLNVQQEVLIVEIATEKGTVSKRIVF